MRDNSQTIGVLIFLLNTISNRDLLCQLEKERGRQSQLDIFYVSAVTANQKPNMVVQNPTR